MKPNIQEIHSQLTALLKVTHDMNDCLVEEQAALSTIDSESILAASDQKKTVLKRLEQQAVHFHKHLINSGIANGLSAFSQWIEKQAEPSLAEMKQDWLKIQELTQTNKMLNEANGACISISQRQAQRSIEILRGQQGFASQTYGRDGAPQGVQLGLRHTIV